MFASSSESIVLSAFLFMLHEHEYKSSAFDANKPSFTTLGVGYFLQMIPTLSLHSSITPAHLLYPDHNSCITSPPPITGLFLRRGRLVSVATAVTESSRALFGRRPLDCDQSASRFVTPAFTVPPRPARQAR